MKKNILFIIPWLPYPINSGGRQAIVNGLLAVKDTYNIYITYIEEDNSCNEEDKLQLARLFEGGIQICPYIKKTQIEKRTLSQKLAGRGIHFLQKFTPKTKFRGNPYTYWIDELLPSPKEFANHINLLIQQNHIEIVQSEMLRNLALVHCLPDSVKKVFVHHELGFVRHALELQTKCSETFDGRAILEASKCLEISQLNKYDSVITLSPIDTQKLSAAGVTTRLQTSFAIVDEKEPSAIDTDWKYELTFVGPDTHEPNFFGVMWFLENCWEQIVAKDERFHLTIIGKWKDVNKSRLLNKYNNLSFAGFVDNLADALRGTVMIVPLTVGSGIRMKILEASNIGIPFVSTTIGAEGIPLASGTHCLIADTPSEFVNAIERMKNDSLRTNCALAAHELVKEKYSMNALRKNRNAIYQSLL